MWDQLTLELQIDTIRENQLQKGNTMTHQHYWEMPTKLTDFDNEGIEKKVVYECQCGEAVLTDEEIN